MFRDHVAEVDADAEPDAALFGHVWLSISHPALDLNCTPHGIHNTGKLREHAVAGVLHDATAVFRDLRIDQVPKMSREPFVRALLILPH
jgi:hypothetical protein